MAEVLNHDVAGLHRRINRFIFEASRSGSGNLAEMSQHDQDRMMSYLSAVRSYVAWVVAQPDLDLPETAPKIYVLDDNPTWDPTENESTMDLIRMLELARDEVTNGQSARRPSGLVAFDRERLIAVIEKAERFLTEYVAQVTPLDLPESSPMRVQVPAGRTGI